MLHINVWQKWWEGAASLSFNEIVQAVVLRMQRYYAIDILVVGGWQQFIFCKLGLAVHFRSALWF